MPRVCAAVLFSAMVIGGPTTAMAQRYCPPTQPAPRRYCPPTTPGVIQPDATPVAPGRDEPAPEPGLDGTQQPQQRAQAPSNMQQVTPQQAQPTFNPSSQSQPTTAATSAQAIAPNTIGDFFGTGGMYFDNTYLAYPVYIPTAASAGGNVGRQKFGENVSPIPRDRVFLNYSLFTNAPLSANGVDVNRFTPGFEKTFQDGNMSFEMRMPFASTLDSTLTETGADTSEFEWGDLTIFLKALLYNTDEIAFAGGVGFSFPTHDALVVRDQNNGNVLLKADSSAIHVLPYLAALWTPNDQLFVQLFGQIDADMNGGAVYVDDGGGPINAGRLQDQTYLFLDLTAGYWVYQNPCGNIRGIAPIVEFHYNRSLNDADTIVTTGSTLGGAENDLSLLNMIVGLSVFTHNNLQLQAGYGFPVGGADDQFDGEFRLTINWLFGGGNLYSAR
ncbi:MAG: hypothetical protein KF861_21755 [Planctomycetaceae bacterium]|nr:hypothetical protein [Planctomycetaceae bacterium]